MKVKQLFIIANTYLDGEGEVLAGAGGLSIKYNTDNIIAIDDPALPSSSNWQTYINGDTYLRAWKEYIHMITYDEPNVGIYVICHGTSGKAGNLTGAQLSSLINELGFCQIRKICVVACNTAHGDPGQTFMTELCMGISSSTPKIAAWNKGVWIASDDKSITKTGGTGYLHKAAKAGDPKKLLPPALVGKKTRKTGGASESHLADRSQSLNRLMTEDVRNQIKVAYQKRGNSAVAIPLSEWHDT